MVPVIPMELRNLKTFLRAAALKSFTAAGRELGYSQANISAQIRQLETNLQAQGVPVTGMHCEKGTAGKNAVGPSMRNRFQTPRTDGTEANG